MLPFKSRLEVRSRIFAAILIVLAALRGDVFAANQTVFVVLPTEPIESVKQAADELEAYVSKATGWQVSRLSLGDWKDSQRPAILLGLPPKNSAKLEGRDAYALQAADDVLRIWGDDAPGSVDSVAPKGTLYGVYDYLKNDCGVRFLFPGPQGEVIPVKPVPLKIRGINRASAPAFEQRLLATGSWLETDEALVKSLNRDPEHDQRLLRWHRVWMLRNRLHTKRVVDANHAFTQWWERYGAEHPTWFAQHRNGKRDLITKPHLVKLCTSNPEVVSATAERGLEKVAANPWMRTISASPNDSALTGMCMCPNCRKLDAADALPFTLRDRQGSYSYPSLTDRHVVFWNQVALELSKKRPDLMVAGYAYGSHHTPPIKAKPLPNVMIGFVQHAGAYWDFDAFKEERDYFNGWAKTRATMLWRPNILQMGHGIPSNYLVRLGHDLQYVNQRGAMYAAYDILIPNWGTMGHTYYVLAELLWDVDKPLNDILKEYLAAAYGPGQDKMREYYQELGSITDELFNSRKVDVAGWKAGGEVAAVQIYSGKRWARLKQLLKEARQQVGAYPMGLKMLDMHEQGMEFFDLQLAVNQQLYFGPKPSNFERGPLAESIAKRDAWLKKNPKSLAISTTDMAATAVLMQKVADRYQPAPRGKLEVDE